MKIRVIQTMLLVTVLACAVIAQTPPEKKVELDSWSVTVVPVSTGEFTLGGTYSWHTNFAVKVSGNGFFEWYGDKSWVTNHQLKFSIRQVPYVTVLTEQGGSPDSYYFQVAGEFQPMEIPRLKKELKKLLSNLSISYFVRLTGQGPRSQLEVSWETNEFPLWKWQGDFEGFCRAGANQQAFCRAEVWTHSRASQRVKFGVRFQRAGGTNQLSLGAKILSKN